MDTQLALLPTESEWTRIKEIATQAVKSGFLPNAIKTPEQAGIIALKGWELGLKPMVAFSHIHVVNGKPGCSAELLLAGIRQQYPKAKIQFVESTDKLCRIKAQRPDEAEGTEFKFTIEEAQKAQLLNKDVWKSYATDMLRARCITRMKRAMFPEVMMGLDHTPEELDGAPIDLTTGKPTKTVGAEVAPTPEAKSIKDLKPDAQKPASNESQKPEVLQPEAPKSEFDNFTDGPGTVARTRMDIVKDIQKEASRLKWSNERISQFIKDKSGMTTNELPDVDMETILLLMKGEKSQ